MTEKQKCRCGYPYVKDWQTGQYRKQTSYEIEQARFTERLMIFFMGFGVAFVLSFIAFGGGNG